jgi:hypothetical protein
MAHYTNDPLGPEGSRPQDAVPTDEAGRQASEPVTDHIDDRGDQEPEDLNGLADLAPSSASNSTAEQPRPPRRKRRTTSRRRDLDPAAAAISEAGSEDDGEALHDLEAKGFTPDEARRLIDITARLAQSAEAREAEATRRRLHFTRWLLDHGRLDEWSA